MTKRYKVLDTGLPATAANFAVPSSFSNNEFDTLEEAQEYALEWLGEAYSKFVPRFAGERCLYSGRSYIEIVR